jgi:hypothetical protein
MEGCVDTVGVSIVLLKLGVEITVLDVGSEGDGEGNGDVVADGDIV